MINYERRTSGRIGSRRFRQHGPQLAHAHTPPPPSPHPPPLPFCNPPRRTFYIPRLREPFVGDVDSNIYYLRNLRDAVEVGRSFIRSFISFIQSLSQRRGSASIPCSLRIAAEDRKKNRSGGGGGAQDNDRVGAERPRTRTFIPIFIYHSSPQKTIPI